MLYRYEEEKNIDFKILEPEGYFKKNRQKALENSGYIILYDSAIKTGDIRNDVVHAEFFIPENIRPVETGGKIVFSKQAGSLTNQKIIILLHGFNSTQGWLHNFYYFIKKAINNNFAVLFINLPYHLNRTPEGEQSGQRLIKSRDTELLEFFDQSVKDIQKAIFILKKSFDDSTCPGFYICGLSLGGMVAAVTSAWEPEIKKSILMECGGNWDDIYWNSFVRLILRGTFIDKDKIKRKQAADFYSVHPSFIEELRKINPSQIEVSLSEFPGLSVYPQKTMFLSDPLTFAYRAKPENILMVNAKYDILFCRSSTEKLWDGFGKPEIIWLNGFHGTGMIANKFVIKKVFDFIGNP